MILAELKQRTREHHLRVENRVPLFQEGLSALEYRAVLCRFYGFYAPIEQRLEPGGGWNALGLDSAARRKSPLLRADLRFLGMPDDEFAELPVCDSLPGLATVPQALGCMYVLEGATLGGKLIERHLRRTLGVSRDRGCAFFGCYGDDVGPMWKAFGAALAAYAAAHPVAEEIVLGACETFTMLDQWLLTPGA